VRHNKIARPMTGLGHLLRGHVDGMSAIAPIATELLREGNGRKGPSSTFCIAEKTEIALQKKQKAFADH
jgi:hypothetical protein